MKNLIISHQLSSGKLLHHYGKSQSLIGTLWLFNIAMEAMAHRNR